MSTVKRINSRAKGARLERAVASWDAGVGCVADGLRAMTFRMPEAHRDADAGNRIYGWPGDETCGVFRVASRAGRTLHVIAASGEGWEHVSVSCTKGRRRNLTPKWSEMCAIKALFWGDEDCVVQYHPPKSQHVNQAEALHLWRPTGGGLPRPPSILVSYTDEDPSR